MSFEHVPSDELEDWRANPITVAYLAMLRDQVHALMTKTVHMAATSEAEWWIRSLAGQTRGLEIAISLAATKGDER